MSINHSEIMVPVHGGMFHSTCIFLAKYICLKKGYKLKNPDIFSQMFKSPGIPDIYVEYEYKGKDDYGRTKTLKQSVCIEIETNLTAASEKKKIEQFTRPGIHEPIIIDMGKGYEEYKIKQKERGITFNNDIECIAEYIESMLVL